MTDYYIELRNIDIDSDNSNENIEYHFKLVQNFDDNGEIPFTNINADQPLNSAQLGFDGKERVTPIRWLIYDNGNDKSRKTWENQVGSGFDNNLGADITTVEDQIYYLSRFIQNSTTGAAWRFFGGFYSDPDGQGLNGTPVALEDLSIQRVPNAPFARARMRLKWGLTVG